MDLHIECPVCEQRFTTPDVPLGHAIECPACERSFDHTFEVELEPEELESGSTNALAGELAYSKHLSVPDATETFSEPTPAKANSDYSDTISAFHKLERKRRKRKRLLITLLSSAVLAGVIGVMIGMLLKQLKKNELAKEETTNSGETVQKNDGFGFADHISKQSVDSKKNLDTVEDKTPVPWVVPDVIPPQKFDGWTRSQARDCWTAVHPHLVSLTVYDGLGSHEAVGTIVDSRGWILTSYSSIKGASKIEVRSSVGSVHQLTDADLLEDLVRGYIEVDKEKDLAILAINRRFVIAFTFLELARRNKVVERQYLLQCGPPGEHNLHGCSESQISFRGTIDQLDKISQDKIKSREINGNELIWLKANSAVPPAPGTPLFDSDNELVAINSFYEDKAGKHISYFVPVDRAVTLISESDGETKPLSDLGTGRSGEIVSVAESNPFREKVVDLNRLTISCSEFDWIPKTLEQYQDFQSFAKRYMEIEAESRRLSGSTLAEEQKIISLQKNLADTLRKRFTGLSINDKKSLGKMNNEFAVTELLRLNRFAPFYGEVTQVVLGRPELGIRIYDSQTKVVVPLSENVNPPKPDSKFLFFVKTKTGRGSRLMESMLMIR
jgi:hypothetical protein